MHTCAAGIERLDPNARRVVARASGPPPAFPPSSLLPSLFSVILLPDAAAAAASQVYRASAARGVCRALTVQAHAYAIGVKKRREFSARMR